jgi:hypothetical protein
MRRADVDSLGPRRYVERHIGPLVDAEAESATEGELDAGVRPQGRHDDSSSGWPIIDGVGLSDGYSDANSSRTADVDSPT